MCLAAAYEGAESEAPILREIARVTVDGDDVQLETLFGEQTVLRGKIAAIDFMKSRIVIEGAPAIP